MVGERGRPHNTLLSGARRRLRSPSGSGRVLSRQELAEAVNTYQWDTHQVRDRVSENDIGKLERGEHRWPGRLRREAFRAVLGAATDAELGFYILRGAIDSATGQGDAGAVPSVLGAVTPANLPRPYLRAPASTIGPDPGRDPLLALRRALDSHDLPPDGPVRALALLERDVKRVVELRLQSRYRHLAVLLPPLLGELHRALQCHIGQRRAVVAGLLTQTYRAADALAAKLGHHDLSARIIPLMEQAAHASGDELGIAAAAYVRAEVFFANGDLDTGQVMLQRAADRLIPESSPGAAAAFGALHMRAAVLAARAGKLNPARDHLTEARAHSVGLTDGVYHGTVFGVASVRIHEIALCVDGAEPGQALKLASRWRPPPDLPAERRSHFHIDVARAHMQLSAFEDCLDALFTARTIAPENVHDHRQVHHLLRDLARSPIGRDPRLRDYYRWVHQPVTAIG